MTLKGQAFLIVWHDIRAEGEPEYHRWHTREHMPERLAIPGFLRGRRGVDWSRERHRYLTLYEGAALETFGSPAYLARLNNPTPWSSQVLPFFCNFIRGACAIVATTGRGVGGAMATIRVPRVGADTQAVIGSIMDLDGVASVHVGVNRPDTTSARTRETALRATTRDGLFDAVVLVDGIGRREMEAALPGIVGAMAAKGWSVSKDETAVYDMAFMLEPE
jgi:hypothetical protein